MAEKTQEQQQKTGVLLLAHGAPEKLEDIPEFLLNVRNGRPLPAPAVEEIKRRYAEIGGGSPLLHHTQRQGKALAQRLRLPVYVGMRNWHPFIGEAVRQVVGEEVQRLVAICLAPQNSRTSIGKYRERLDEALRESGGPLELDFVESWHDQPQLIAAFAEKLRARLAEATSAAGSKVPVILTAHSVPEKTVAAGDPYDRQVRETAEQVAVAAGCDDWQLAFQSRGMTAEPWIGPSVESLLDQLGARGHRHVLLAPIGFVSDHVEILYDVDIAFRDYAQAKGMKLWRTESLNDSPLLIEALASLVRQRIRS